jgi:hypothetical protein
MEFIPFMILTAVVVVLVAAWGYARSGAAAATAPTERLPDAEQDFADCLRARGIDPPALKVYRDPGGGLVIVGPSHLDPATRQALSECDAELAARYGEAPSASAD